MQVSEAMLRAMEQTMRTEIPITQYLEFSVDRFSSEGLVLQTPLAANINHKGTVFGGSLNKKYAPI